jgi:Zn-dependent protease with chaperone function
VSSVVLCLALLAAVHFLVASVLSLGIAAALPALESGLRRLDPERRAEWTFLLALLPAALGLATALGLALPAWLRYEPPGASEHPGFVLLALGCAGAALVAARVGVALVDQWRTTCLVRAFRARGRDLPGLSCDATGFPHELPVAALAGVLRPRLLLSDLVLRALSPGELRAVVAHERAHVAARENLKRLLLRASPDPLALLPAGSRMRAAFEEAAEAAADRAACAVVSPLLLARALLKVAALLPPGRRLELAGAGLHREGTISSRVRALVVRHEQGVAPGSHLRSTESACTWVLPVAALALAGAWVPLPAVHRVLETLVHLLP